MQLLIVKQILLVSILGNLCRTVWRICILIILMPCMLTSVYLKFQNGITRIYINYWILMSKFWLSKGLAPLFFFSYPLIQILLWGKLQLHVWSSTDFSFLNFLFFCIDGKRTVLCKWEGWSWCHTRSLCCLTRYIWQNWGCLFSSITFQELVDLNSRLILSLPEVTKDEFLLTTSVPFQAGRWREVEKLSSRGMLFDWPTNSWI